MALKEFKLTGVYKQDAKFIQRVIQRLARRARKTSTVIVPPIPVSHYQDSCEADEVVFRYLFTSGGTVKTACVAIEEWPVNGKGQEIKDVMLSIQLGGDQQLITASHRMSKKSEVFEIGQVVLPGTKLSVKLDKPVKGLWLGFLYTTDTTLADIHEVAISELEALETEATDNGADGEGET